MIDFSALVLGPAMAAFGEVVTYVSRSSRFTITGVFDEGYLAVDPYGESPSSNAFGGMGDVNTVMPVLGVQVSQFPGGTCPEQGDQLTIVRTNMTYLVKDVRPDSHGGAKLMLTLASASR
jgi:hypothetical protein